MSLAWVKRTTPKKPSSTPFFHCGSHLKTYTFSLKKVTSVEKMLISLLGAAWADAHFYQGRDKIFEKKVTERPPNDHSERDFRS